MLYVVCQPRLQRFASVNVGTCRVGDIEHFPPEIYTARISEKSIELLTSRLILAEATTTPRLAKLGAASWRD
jgi:hypothetical protein